MNSLGSSLINLGNILYFSEVFDKSIIISIHLNVVRTNEIIYLKSFTHTECCIKWSLFYKRFYVDNKICHKTNFGSLQEIHFIDIFFCVLYWGPTARAIENITWPARYSIGNRDIKNTIGNFLLTQILAMALSFRFWINITSAFLK